MRPAGMSEQQAEGGAVVLRGGRIGVSAGESGDDAGEVVTRGDERRVKLDYSGEAGAFFGVKGCRFSLILAFLPMRSRR